MPRRRPFQRVDRLNRTILKVLGTAVTRETREEILKTVTVTGVEVTRDLSLARVYYYAPDETKAETVSALERALGFLRSRVGQEVRMRQTPELRFIFDDSIARASRLESILSTLEIPAAELEEDGDGTT
jgi:ribosome-binding factor A